MHNWRDYIRQDLPPLSVGPARETEIVAELALQMEQAWSDAMAGGASDNEALRKARSQFGDWNALARAIEAAEIPAATRRSATLTGIWQDLRYSARFLE